MKFKIFALVALCLIVFGFSSCGESEEISNKTETDVEIELGEGGQTFDFLVGEWTGKFFYYGDEVRSFDNFKIEILDNKDIKVYERKGDTYVERTQHGFLTEQLGINGILFLVNLNLDENALGIDYEVVSLGRERLVLESIYESEICRIEFNADHADYVSEIKGVSGGNLNESAQLKLKEELTEVLNKECWNDISRGTAMHNFKNALKKVVEAIQTKKLYNKYNASGDINIEIIIYDKYTKKVVRHNTILVTEYSSTLK